jgi:hypothetical protein
VTGYGREAYAAARDLTLAVDTFRLLSQAGLVTETDIGRVESATRAYVGPERDLHLDGACGSSLTARCFNGDGGCRVHGRAR